jgi:hypothetical protein
VHEFHANYCAPSTEVLHFPSHCRYSTILHVGIIEYINVNHYMIVFFVVRDRPRAVLCPLYGTRSLIPCYEYQKIHRGTHSRGRSRPPATGVSTPMKMGLIKKWDLRASQKPQHTPQKTPKMAEPRPYDPLLHGFIWPLLGQKSSHKKCYRTEIIATSARVIWPRAVALPDGFTIPWLPSCTADDVLHHEQTAGK